MIHLQKNYQTLILVLVGSIIFGLIDLYFINLSSYVCGALLAWIWIERKKNKLVKEVVGLKKESDGAKCTGCGGRARKLSAKRPGGIEQYRCDSCHKKFEKVNGKLRQVAV